MVKKKARRFPCLLCRGKGVVIVYDMWVNKTKPKNFKDGAYNCDPCMKTGKTTKKEFFDQMRNDRLDYTNLEIMELYEKAK